MSVAKFVLWQSLHADEQSATLPRPSGPVVNQLIDGLPAPEIEVTDTKIRTVRDFQSLPQGRKKILFNVVEDAGHGARKSLLLRVSSTARGLMFQLRNGSDCPPQND